MKIRIKGNSIRLRLTKSDVTTICTTGILEEQTLFLLNSFTYALQTVEDGNELSANFESGRMTIFIPKSMTRDWEINDTVGFQSSMKITGTDSLKLLVEKDFICLDETTEDQTDHYKNPKINC